MKNSTDETTATHPAPTWGRMPIQEQPAKALTRSQGKKFRAEKLLRRHGQEQIRFPGLGHAAAVARLENLKTEDMQNFPGEKVFFDANAVSVTSARFSIGSQTFAMSGVTSVRSAVDKSGMMIGIVFLVSAVVFLAVPPLAVILGLLGAFCLVLHKTQYHVFLNTASGETKALSSKDEQFIQAVVSALNEAIVHRG